MAYELRTALLSTKHTGALKTHQIFYTT